MNASLFNALHSGDIGIVRYCLATGADVNGRVSSMVSKSGDTPLNLAARNGHTPLVEFLVSQGAYVNAGNIIGATALHDAAYNGHADTVECLVGLGANVNTRDKAGVAPLHIAAYNGHAATVECLVSLGANVNIGDNDDGTALHMAARNGHAAIVEYLVLHGANVTAVNSDGYTPLDRAAKFGHAAIVQILKQAKVRPSSIQPPNEKLAERRNAILALLSEDSGLRNRLGIRSDFSPSAEYDVERLLQYTLSKRDKYDPKLKEDVESGIAFHIETARFVAEESACMKH